MKSARFLVVALLPLLAACVAAVPTSGGSAATGYSGSGATIGSRVQRNPLRIVGEVLDASSRQPVAGVGVWAEGSFDYLGQTDANGHFVLHLPHNRSPKNGRLLIASLFYEGSASVPADTTQAVTILLRRNAYRRKPSSCQPLVDAAQHEPYDAVPIVGYPGNQYAFLIRDSTSQPPRKLRTITIRLGKGGFPRETFQLRIYRLNDPANASPGNYLLEENFMIEPAQKEGFYTYDVSDYDIMVSGAGFYLGIEYWGYDVHYVNQPLVSYTPIGPVLRPPCARPNIRTWEYTIGKGWHRATAAENCWPLYESALSVEVEPAPAKH